MKEWAVIVVGLPGVGKSTLSARLAERLGTVAVNSGDLLRHYMVTHGVKLDDETATGTLFLKHFGETVAGDVIASGAATLGARVIDGVRLYSNIEAFHRRGIVPHIALLTTPPDLRRERFVQRALREGVMDRPSAERVLHVKDRWGEDLPRFEAVCRWRFENSRSLDDLERFGDRLAAEMRSPAV